MDLQIMLMTVIALMALLSGIWLIIQLSLSSVKENQARLESSFKENQAKMGKRMDTIQADIQKLLLQKANN